MIELIVLDVDGTLTDGKIIYTNNGDEIKSFDVSDGLAIAVWTKKFGKKAAIITGRKSSLVEKRAKELNIDIELFKNGEIAQLFDLDISWLNSLIKVKSIEDLKDVIPLVPSSIKTHLEKLLNTALQVDYDNLVIAPLYHGSLKYYDDVYFRVIQNNFVICKGGKYSADGISSLGFALYTDSLLKILED